MAQGVWAGLPTISGTYSQLYSYVVFAVTLFHVATGAAVFVLRRRRPQQPRPYRVRGYPLVPGLFIVSCALLVVGSVIEKPVESLWGLGLVALGLPSFMIWYRGSATAAAPREGAESS